MKYWQKAKWWCDTVPQQGKPLEFYCSNAADQTHSAVRSSGRGRGHRGSLSREAPEAAQRHHDITDKPSCAASELARAVLKTLRHELALATAPAVSRRFPATHACNAKGRMYSPRPSRGHGLAAAMQGALAAAKRKSRRPMLCSVHSSSGKLMHQPAFARQAGQAAQQQLHHGSTCRRKRLSLRMSDVAAKLTGNGKLRAEANDEVPAFSRKNHWQCTAKTREATPAARAGHRKSSRPSQASARQNDDGLPRQQGERGCRDEHRCGRSRKRSSESHGAIRKGRKATQDMVSKCPRAQGTDTGGCGA